MTKEIFEDRIESDTPHVEAKSDTQVVRLRPQGALLNWQVVNPEGQTVDVLYEGEEEKRIGSPLLFPNSGASGEKSELPGHGFGRDSEWEVAESSNGRVVLQLTPETISEEAREQYPYDFETKVSAAPVGEGSMVYKMTVINNGDEPMPIAPGLHTNWNMPLKDKPQLVIEGIEGFDATDYDDWTATDEDKLPDTPYPYEGMVTVIMPDREIDIEDITQGGPVTTRAVVWSPTADKTDHDFVSVEPVTREDGGLSDDPIMIEPGEEWEMELKFSVRFLEDE